jgi:hypothetical protein
MARYLDPESFPKSRERSEATAILGVMVVSGRPRSRGRRTIVSADPLDASIMPNVVRADKNATSKMIGERVSDWLPDG